MNEIYTLNLHETTLSFGKRNKREDNNMSKSN